MGNIYVGKDLTCRPTGTFSLPAAGGVDLLRCSPDQDQLGMKLWEQKAPPQKLQQAQEQLFVSGLMDGVVSGLSTATKPAEGGGFYIVIIQVKEYLSHRLWGEVPVGENPSWGR